MKQEEEICTKWKKNIEGKYTVQEDMNCFRNPYSLPTLNANESHARS